MVLKIVFVLLEGDLKRTVPIDAAKLEKKIQKCKYFYTFLNI